MPQPPISARVAVETLRRDRSAHDARLAELRARARGARGARPGRACARSSRPPRPRAAEAEAEVAAPPRPARTRRRQARDAAAAAEREVAEREAVVNKAWREASTELERLREAYEDDDRTRGDIERRIREAERLIREGHQADPDELVAAASATTTRSSRSRSAPSSCSAGSRCSGA